MLHKASRAEPSALPKTWHSSPDQKPAATVRAKMWHAETWRGTCGICVPARVGKLGGGRVQGVLARAAGEVARFGKQLAVLAFSGRFGATLSQDAEFLRVQPLPPLGVSELERKLTFRAGHERVQAGSGIWIGGAKRGVNNNYAKGQQLRDQLLLLQERERVPLPMKWRSLLFSIHCIWMSVCCVRKREAINPPVLRRR